MRAGRAVVLSAAVGAALTLAAAPAALIAFFWHYARQATRLFIALFVVGFVVALLDTMIPIFIGRVITLITTSRLTSVGAGRN